MKNLKKNILTGLLLMSSCVAFAQLNALVATFDKSIAFEGKKDYTMAIAAMNEGYDAKSYETNVRLGWLYYKSAKYNEAMSYYQKAIDLVPSTLEPKVGYLYPAAATGTSEVDKLINQYAKILEINPKDVNSNYQLGFYNYNKGNMDIAKNYFSKIIDLYPSGYEYYLRIAWAKINKSTAQSATVLAAFTKSYEFENKADYASAITPLVDVYDFKNYDINLRLGYLYYMNLNYTEAVKYYQIAIDLKPNSIESRLAYVYPAYQLGNTENIFNQYKKIVELDPQNTSAYYQLGLIYYNKKDYANANMCFEKIVKLYPFTYDGLLMYAWTNYRSNKNAEAKNLFNKVLMLSPNDKSALEGLALIK
jgi:tetratricopeptide (TPR) repeat protein